MLLVIQSAKIGQIYVILIKQINCYISQTVSVNSFRAQNLLIIGKLNLVDVLIFKFWSHLGMRIIHGMRKFPESGVLMTRGSSIAVAKLRDSFDQVDRAQATKI